MSQRKLSITMIGTGSAFNKKHYNNSAVVKIHEGTADQFFLLLDCGPTTYIALEDCGIPIKQIDGIFITHLHHDHVGGLEELALRMRYEHKRKMKLYLPSDLVYPLWYQTLRGGLEVTSEGINELRDYFDVYPIERYFNIEGIWFEIKSTLHVPGMPNFSLFIADKVFYSGDIAFDRHLIEEVASRCELILHDCQLNTSTLIHASINQLLTLPADTQGKMKLMHYGENVDEYKGRVGRLSFVEVGQQFVIGV